MTEYTIILYKAFPQFNNIFLNPIASPVLVAFFDGFILALAATKHRFDVQLVRVVAEPLTGTSVVAFTTFLAMSLPITEINGSKHTDHFDVLHLSSH